MLVDLATDITRLSLREFVCSDFNSNEGSNDYPSRNCTVADAIYRDAPKPFLAPCCKQEDLVTASLQIMAWNEVAPSLLEDDFLSPGPVSIQDLLEMCARRARVPVARS